MEEMEIKFYADSEAYKNKLFTFKVENENRAIEILRKWKNTGNYIRAAYMNVVYKTMDNKRVRLKCFRLDSNFLKNL